MSEQTSEGAGLGERIRAEADIADRPGQYDRLNQIALDVERALAEAHANARWFRRQADHHIGRANRAEQAHLWCSPDERVRDVQQRLRDIGFNNTAARLESLLTPPGTPNPTPTTTEDDR